MGIVDLGRAFPVSHGGWVSGGGTGTGGAYERLSIVRHLGKTWISAIETTEEPTNGSVDWDIMVEDTSEFVKPVVQTVSVGNITSTSATVTINLQKFGLVANPNDGVEYRKVGTTTWSRTVTQTPTAIGNIGVGVSGLALTTNYEVRAFATDPKNPDILAVGDIETFTTTNNTAPVDGTYNNAPTMLFKNQTIQVTFSGATDSDGTVTHYVVDQISSANLTVTTAEVAAGSPHTFNVGAITADETVTYRIRAKDDANEYSAGRTITCTLKAIAKTQKAIFGYGTNGSQASMTNLVSNTGVVSADTASLADSQNPLIYGTYVNLNLLPIFAYQKIYFDFFSNSQWEKHLAYSYNANYRDWETDRKSTRLNSSHRSLSRMPSSA